MEAAALGYKTCGKFTGDEIEDLFFLFGGARSGLMAVDQSSRVRVVGSGREGRGGNPAVNLMPDLRFVHFVQIHGHAPQSILLLRVINSLYAKHIQLSMTRQDMQKK